MANPTTNFGWQMPTSSDLVTDLPADFEVFGQAVDTALVDLKGGTTGQILAKNSNTDMDFVWTSANPGDITAVTAGTGITGGGTSGDVTVSFDQANFGGGQWAAGKNKIINGDFRINQRAFTTTTTSGAYGFDRFPWTGAGSGTQSYSAQTFTAGTAPVAGYEAANFARITTSSQNATDSRVDFDTTIEDVRTFAGQTTTLSFWAKAASGTPKVAVEATQSFGTGGSPSAFSTNYIGQITLSTSWARYSITVAVPSLSGKTVGTTTPGFLGLNLWVSAGSTYNARTGSLGAQNNTFDFWGVQLEAGSTATPFQTATGTIQGELAACQRYYQRVTGTASNTAYICSGVAISTTRAFLNYPAPVTFRSAPSIAQSSASIGNGVISNQNITTITYYSSGSLQQISIDANVGSGLTASGAFFLALPQNAYIELSAEL